MLRYLKDKETNIGGIIVSFIETMLSIGLNLSSILLFFRFFKKHYGIETIPKTMFITGIFCCATNLAYGIVKGDKILNNIKWCLLWTSNSIWYYLYFHYKF